MTNADFFLPYFRAMEIVTWKFHVDDYAEGGYIIILDRYFPTAMELDINISEHITIGGT